MSITESFNKLASQSNKGFTITHFKSLLLDFIVNNNISFRAIITPSFKRLLNYLNLFIYKTNLYIVKYHLYILKCLPTSFF